ncbi:MAG: TonB-dependent receptor [Balneolaceae bacterium]|nr:TonB-dependent receptor [Balneolaceae bacterium]
MENYTTNNQKGRCLPFLKMGVFLILFIGLAGQQSIAQTAINGAVSDRYQQAEEEVNLDELIVSVNFENYPLDEAILMLGEKSGVMFNYNANLLPDDVAVTYQANNVTLAEALYSILPENINHIAVRNFVILQKDDEPEIDFEELYQETVTGRVTDAVTGEPLTGVNIVIQGTTTGTTTDLDGTYSINIEEAGTDLIFSYIGYHSQTVTVQSHHISDGLDVSLEEDVAMMDEMVVVGFGTQRRGDVTGAVSSVSAQDLETRQTPNTALALQGASPGLSIQDQGGHPGEEDVVVRIRGTGTLNNPNPLVLVDGVEQSLSSVEASNIESITVMKDAASAAIYGSRAANGVILVTTKRGADTGLIVNYGGYIGVHNERHFPEAANKEDWMLLRNEADINAGATPVFTEEYISNVLAGTNPLEYPFADFEGAVFRENALEHSHSLSLSTGSDTGRLYAAINHHDTEGIMRNFSNHQTSLRVNSDLFVTDDLTFQANLLYRNRQASGPGFTAQRITQALLHMNRDMIMQYPDGRTGTGDIIGGTWSAYVMSHTGETQRINNDIVGSAGLTYQINDAFAIEGDFTINQRIADESIFREDRSNMIHPLTGSTVAASGWFATNTLNEGRYNRRELSQRAFLNFEQSLNVHRFSGVAGYEEVYTRARQVSAARANFFNDELRSLNAGDSGNQQTCSQFHDAGSFTGTCFNDAWRVRSFFSRLNYTYDDRYSFQANARYDGSSRFAEGNRWGFFPSFSASWRITSEQFMQDVDLLSNLRLRASWGQLGNERMSTNERTGLHSHLNSFNLGLSYQFGDNVASAAAVTAAGNPDISWETTTMRNIGLDVGFLDDRVEVIAEYFWNYTSDILLQLPVPLIVGVSAPFQNAAEVSNEGWEVEVIYRSMPSTDSGFQWSLGVNVSDVTNTIEDLRGQGPFYPDAFTVWTEGESLSALRGYRSPGLYRTQEDLDAYPTKFSPDVGIGDWIFEDLTGDGSLSTALYPDGDHVVLADEDPRFEFGVNFNAAFRGFDFTMFLQGVMRQYHMLDGALVEGPNNQNFIHQKYVRERYHPELNPDGTWPRVMVGSQDWNRRANENWVEDTKYLRLKNIELGYSVQQPLVQSLRVFVSGRDLLTFTPTELFDPEVPRGRNQFYPHTKAITAGVNVTF